MIDLTVPWVLLRVRDQLYGVPASHIREMAEMPAVTHVPNMPEFVMGLVSLRGQVTPTINMRQRLGVATAEEDIKLLTDGLGRAEAEHHRLAETLESVIRDGHVAGFDAHACGFLEWLGTLKSKNPLVRLHLKKLEEPHARLHAAAARLVEIAETNPLEAKAAFRSFQEKELAAFMRLLPQIRERLILAHRQIVVVLTLNGQSLGAAVDEVESIERLKNGSIEELPAGLSGMKSNLTKMVGRRTRDDEIVLILEVEELFHGNGQVPVHGEWMEQAESTPVPAPEPAPVTAPLIPIGIAETATAMTGARAATERMAVQAADSVEEMLVPAGAPAEAMTASAAVSAGAATVPAAASAGAMTTMPATPRIGYADGLDDRAWCGDCNGPWVQLEDGPIVQPGTTWALEEAETSGSPGSPWM